MVVEEHLSALSLSLCICLCVNDWNSLSEWMLDLFIKFILSDFYDKSDNVKKELISLPRKYFVGETP